MKFYGISFPTGRLGPMEEFMANLNPKRCISDHIPGFEFVDLLLQPLVFLFEVGYVFRLDVLVLLQVVHLRVLLLTATEIQHTHQLKTRQKGKRLPCYYCTVFFPILNQFLQCSLLY